MAEKSAEASASVPTTPSEGGSGNWWDSWLTSAKTKSAEVYSMVRKDLDEIGSAMKSEATHVFSTTSNVIGKTFKLDVPESPANVMKKSLSTFIGQVSTVLSPEPDDEDDTEVILSSGDTTMLSTYKKELEALQRVDATFIVPADSPELSAWKASLEAAEGVISAAAAARRLDTSALLRAQYHKLVPDAVTHDQFWERYLFRVALLQDRLAAASRKQPQAQPSTDPVLAHLPMQTDTVATVAHAAEPVEQSPKKVLSGIENETPYDMDNVAWEDDFANDLELTEEQQILLLEEYEKEIATKKLSKQTSSRDITNNNTEDKETNTKTAKPGVKGTSKPSNTKPNTTKGNTTKPTASPTKTNNTGNKSRDKQNNKALKKSPKKTKTDVCGNNLVEDYFGDGQVKDDASANSDESWEKEFEIEDVDKA
ncbi:BSD domain-containing protein 1-A-like isoform X2 [Pectinophora gossypiella]|uniref:BSD domain-containing protein 1-A-like isoform X2 n=1 Tax=Pectinophora gossypiella TaxID=13191 RepID=UPI00214E032D|nr:BSD domain-containing protein 1-A-like isoform X2 [Pectinophora gossypiella]